LFGELPSELGDEELLFGGGVGDAGEAEVASVAGLEPDIEELDAAELVEDGPGDECGGEALLISPFQGLRSGGQLRGALPLAID